MKILLLSKELYKITYNKISKYVDIVNKEEIDISNIIPFLQSTHIVYDGILITEEVIYKGEREAKKCLQDFLEYISSDSKRVVTVVLVTREVMKFKALEELSSKYTCFKIQSCDFVRIPLELYCTAFEEKIYKKEAPGIKESPSNLDETDKVKKKRFVFDFFKPKAQNDTSLQATDNLTKELQKISKGISRVVAVTGHRGCGLTSTTVNIAQEASKRGLSTIIIDMDIEYRSTNMYFSSFNEYANKNEEINASLIRTLAKPQDYITTAYNLKENLWLSSLGYHFNDKRLIDQFFACNRFIGMVSVLRHKFNLVIIDIPIDLLGTFKEALIHIDVFGLCVPNNLYAILSTIRNITTILDKEDASYLNAKSKVITTKYNDKSRFGDEIFTPEKVCEVLSSDLSDCFNMEISVAGHVPFAFDFDIQVETDIPIVNTNIEYEKVFGKILLRLMEGAK